MSLKWELGRWRKTGKKRRKEVTEREEFKREREREKERKSDGLRRNRKE